MTSKFAVNKPVLQLLPVQNFRMGFDASKKLDPLPRETRDFNSSPTTDNNGGSLYACEEFSIVSRFDTETEKQCRFNEQEGRGYVPDTVAYYEQETTFYESYDDSDVWLYEQETYDYYGTYSDHYIQMVESGEIIDDGMSCRMGPASLGGSLSEEDWDAAQDDFGYEFMSEVEAEAVAKAREEELDAARQDFGDDVVAEATADQSIEGDTPEDHKAATAEEDSPTAQSAPPSPSTEPAIESDIKLSSQFSKATAPEKEPDKAPATPAVIAPVPVAANNASYQMTA